VRLRRRPQGRVPLRIAPTHWEMTVRDESWSGDSLSGLRHWLLEVKPQPLDPVTMTRNGKRIFEGPWSGMLADEATLW
jgi:hypothetical protein